MSKDNGNGYAFPKGQSDYSENRGMTLRDYFAAKAMASMVATPTYENGGWHQDNIALQAYTMADAMLKARAE